jgi:hypothetical protein
MTALICKTIPTPCEAMAATLAPPLRFENSSLLVDEKVIPLDDIALISVRPPTNPRKSKDTFVHITLPWSLQKVGPFERMGDAEEYADALATAVAAHRKRRAEQTGYTNFDDVPLADHRISVHEDKVVIGKAVYPFARIRNVRKSAYGQPTFDKLFALLMLTWMGGTPIISLLGGLLLGTPTGLVLFIASSFAAWAYFTLFALFPPVYTIAITADTGQHIVSKTHDRWKVHLVAWKFDLWRKRGGDNTPGRFPRRA